MKCGSGFFGVCAVIGMLFAETSAAGTVYVRGETVETDGRELLASALYRFDASDTRSLTVETGVNLKGETVTNVVRWADVRGGSELYAQSVLLGFLATSRAGAGVEPWPKNPFPTFVHEHPTLTEVAMRPGVLRPAVSFGVRNNTATPHSVSNTAAMTFSRAISNLRDSFTVFADQSVGGGGDFIGNGTSSTGLANYMRGYSLKLLNTTYAAAQVKEGRIAVDREPKAPTDVLASGWHVVSFAPTTDTYVDALVLERNCNAGGGLLAEQIAFSRSLSSAERIFMESYLMHKWLGVGEMPALTNHFDTLNVDAGEPFSEPSALYLRALSGCGDVDCPGVLLDASGVLALGCAADGRANELTLGGSLHFAGPFTVRITAETPRLVDVGDTRLLTATGGITGFDPARMTLETNLPETWGVSLVRDGNSLCLRVEKPSVDFEVAGLRFCLDAAGRVKSFCEVETGRELAKPGSAWCRIFDADGAESGSIGLEADDDGRLTFQFANGGCVVERLEERPWGLQFTVESCTLPDGWNLRPACLVPKVTQYVGALANAVSDDESAILLRSFDYDLQMTASASRLSVEMQAGYSAVGKRFGLVAGPRGEILGKARQMILDSGIAHSKAGGPWAMESEVARRSYFFGAGLGINRMDAAIAASKRAGMGILHLDGWYSSLGHYGINTGRFPRGLADLKAAADKIRAAGMRPSIHCLTGCISFHDPLVVPNASPDLLGVYTYTLAEPMTETSTEVVVEEMPDPRQTCLVTTYSSDGSALEIDGEIIVYSGIRRTKPYAFTGITRNRQIKTPARSHAKGARVRYLRQRYNSFYPDPDSALMETLADNIASVYNAIGAVGIYFDGAEGFNNLYGTSKMGALIANRLNRAPGEPHIEMSFLPPHYWPLRSTCYAWDELRYGLKAGIDMHMKSDIANGPKSNFLPMQMGWWGPLVATTDYRSCFPDEYEYFAAKSAGNDAATSLEYIDISAGYPPILQERALTVLGWYERFRLARAFADDVNAELATLGKEGRLRQDETGRWTYTPVVVHRQRIQTPDYGRSWTVDSPRAGSADLRVEALYSAESFASAPATDLFNSNLLMTTVREGQFVTNARDTVSLSVAGAGRDLAKGGDLIALTAVNRQSSSSGAWVGLERSFAAPQYLDLGSAIGIGFYVKGDGSGALLDVSLHQASEYGGVWADHAIRLDFTGWQYFQLLFRERDVGVVRDSSWPHAIGTSEFMTPLRADSVDRVQILINEVPANGTASIQLGPVRLLGPQETPQVLSNVRLTVNGTDLTVPFDLRPGAWAELTDSVWSLYDEAGVLRRRMPAVAPLTLNAGENAFRFAATESVSGGVARAEVKVFAKGDPLPALKPLTDEQRYALRWEPELPVEWVPSNGLTTLPSVKVRPGETANLEVTLRGPIADPVLRVTTAAGTETWTLETVAAGQVKTFADGPLVSGVADVSLESSAAGTADAFVELAKRYRVKGGNVRCWSGGAAGDWADVANWTMLDGAPAESAPLTEGLVAQFSDEQDVTVSVPRDQVGELPLRNLVKSGTGRLTVRTVDYDLPPPVYRFDALSSNSIETVLADGGDGSVRTNLVRWLDADGNGCSARPPETFAVPGAKNGALISTNPVPTVVEMCPGVWRPAVDFGPFSGYYTNTQVRGTAGLSVYAADGTAIAGGLQRIRDTFAVWSDRSVVGAVCFIFTDSTKYAYHRAGRQILHDNDGTRTGTKDGYHAVDGAEVPWNFVLPSGFHVVSFSPTNATAVNRLVWDRTSNAGGALLGEMICYTNVLPIVWRRHLELNLMHKWFGAPAPVWTNAVDNLAIAGSGDLVFPADTVLRATSLAGSGTIECPAVTEVAALSPEGLLTVTGAVSFGPAVSVDLRHYPGLSRAGVYPLLKAESFADLDLDAWDVRADVEGKLSLLVRDGTVFVRVSPDGLKFLLGAR